MLCQTGSALSTQHSALYWMALSFSQARQLIIERIGLRKPAVEHVPLEAAAGRVLAEPLLADRDYPPFARATRDGYAVRAADLANIPAELKCIGEVRAGTSFDEGARPGECVSIMTGAPVPAGADAVVMVEYTRAGFAPDFVIFERGIQAGDNIVPRASEATAGQQVLGAGRRLGYAEIAMLATCGCASVPLFRRPRAGVLPTGDEVVEVEAHPLPFQIRNSNSYSLRVQVAAAGAEPCPLGIAPDRVDDLRRLIEGGLKTDLLLLSGGVSMGKYDLVEQVLRELGAEFYFDSVDIQPGRPLVFGQARGTFFFGLPGNPLSTMVTFELFARPALELLSGAQPAPPRFLRARLAKTVRYKTGLTRFIPARFVAEADEPAVETAGWQGSGDVAALARADCYLVVPPDREEIPAGEMVGIMLK